MLKRSDDERRGSPTRLRPLDMRSMRLRRAILALHACVLISSAWVIAMQRHSESFGSHGHGDSWSVSPQRTYDAAAGSYGGYAWYWSFVALNALALLVSAWLSTLAGRIEPTVLRRLLVGVIACIAVGFCGYAPGPVISAPLWTQEARLIIAIPVLLAVGAVVAWRRHRPGPAGDGRPEFR